MLLILLGLFLWSAVHMFPQVAPQKRAELIEKVGFNAYRGVFALLIFTSVGLMVLGFRGVETPVVLFDIYMIAIIPALIMILAAMILITASVIKSNFSIKIRHPQLTGFGLWAFAHFLINGELHTSVLFGGLSFWAVASIYLINRRDGAFEKAARQLPHKGAMVVAGGFCLFIALVMAHGYITGVDLAAG